MGLEDLSGQQIEELFYAAGEAFGRGFMSVVNPSDAMKAALQPLNEAAVAACIPALLSMYMYNQTTSASCVSKESVVQEVRELIAAIRKES